MAITRSTGETVERVLTLVRQLCKDPLTDPLGNVIETPRFTTGEVIDAVNFQLKDMYNDAEIEHTGESLLSADFTYTPDANTDRMDIPSASVPLDAPIVHVEDRSDGRWKFPIRYVGPTEVESYQNDVRIDGQTLPPSVYTLGAATTGRGQSIRIRPSPGSHAIRVWYLAGPWSVDSAAPPVDVVPFTTDFSEYVACGAAHRLLGDDAGPSLMARLTRCETQFNRRASHMRDDDTIRMEYPHL